jgi:ATP/maltotriose-dependent transcriptional regulator MalT
MEQEGAAREMTLAEWVDELPQGHAARTEFARLVLARDSVKTLTERIAELEKALEEIVDELGEPSDIYSTPITRAYDIAKAALKGGE